MKKIITLFMLSMLLGGCVKAKMYKAYESEYNYQRAQQQSQKGFNELDKQ